jgi:hypothetical protein
VGGAEGEAMQSDLAEASSGNAKTTMSRQRLSTLLILRSARNVRKHPIASVL